MIEVSSFSIEKSTNSKAKDQFQTAKSPRALLAQLALPSVSIRNFHDSNPPSPIVTIELSKIKYIYIYIYIKIQTAKSTQAKTITFCPTSLAWLIAATRSLSVASRTLSPSSSSYYEKQKYIN